MSAELTTQQRIRRDRGMHELGLASIEALPHDILVDTMQQLCLTSGASDATALPGYMAKHMRASAVLPELETFIDNVCEVCTAGNPKLIACAFCVRSIELWWERQRWWTGAAASVSCVALCIDLQSSC